MTCDVEKKRKRMDMCVSGYSRQKEKNKEEMRFIVGLFRAKKKSVFIMSI